MSLQRYDLIAPNGFYIIGNGVCRLTALHPLQGAFTHVMCVMKCNRKCKVWAESAFCILGRINPALRTREHANMRTCEHGVFAHVRVFACSRRIPPSPLEAVLNRRILAWSGKRTTDSPRARSGRLHSLVLAAPAQRGPEVVPAKATCGWFWCYLLPLKGSYTPRHSPRFCLLRR